MFKFAGYKVFTLYPPRPAIFHGKTKPAFFTLSGAYLCFLLRVATLFLFSPGLTFSRIL
jgi:hypothetical protein